MDIKEYIAFICGKYNIDECIVHVYADVCLIACMIAYDNSVEQYPIISFSFLKEISELLGTEDIDIESIAKHEPISNNDNFTFRVSFCMRCNNPKY